MIICYSDNMAMTVRRMWSRMLSNMIRFGSCDPFQQGGRPLPSAQVQHLSRSLPGWIISDDERTLIRRIHLSSVAETQKFAEHVLNLSENGEVIKIITITMLIALFAILLTFIFDYKKAVNMLFFFTYFKQILMTIYTT